VEDKNLESIKNNESKSSMDKLSKAIALYDHTLAKEAIDEIIEQKIDPKEVLKVVTSTMELIGDDYANDKLFLPDLIAAADTMEVIMPDLEAEILRTGSKIKSIGIVVIGTVSGDIHTIGKTMVGTLLKAGGFTVYDIGVDVSADMFIEAIEKHNANILAMSALLTTTAYEQKNVLEILKKKGIREKVKVMVGGGGVTQEFADSIGADGYDSSAPGAVNLAKSLIGK